MVREEHAQALREKVQRATLEQVKDQLEADFRLLRASLPTRDSQAIETAKDMKYMKDRQLHFDRNAHVLSFFLLNRSKKQFWVKYRYAWRPHG